MRENRETLSPPVEIGGPEGERDERQVPHARRQGVVQRRTTNEATEQKREIAGGGCGGKAVDQGDLATGVTLDHIQSLMVNTQANNTSRLTLDKSLIGADGRANTQFFITSTTPGVWGDQVYLRNKNVFSWDASITKTFKIRERGRLDIWAGATNILNHPSWYLGTVTSSNNSNIPVMNIQSTTFAQTTAPGNAARAMQIPRNAPLLTISLVTVFRRDR